MRYSARKEVGFVEEKNFAAMTNLAHIKKPLALPRICSDAVVIKIEIPDRGPSASINTKLSQRSGTWSISLRNKAEAYRLKPSDHASSLNANSDLTRAIVASQKGLQKFACLKI